MESLFGSAPVWGSVPSPVLGWLPPVGTRPTGQVLTAVGTLPFVAHVPQGMASSMTASAVPATAAANVPMGDAYLYSPAFSTPGVIPTLTAPELANVPTARALITAVAWRRGQPTGPTNDQEVEDFLYDVFELVPGASDVEVRCEGGRTTLTGPVTHKRIKRDVGELAWALPAVADVQNNLTIAGRRRARAMTRETESQPVPSRKSA